MGGAMLRGWLDGGLPPKNVSVIDPSPSEAMQQYLLEKGVRHATSADGLDAPDVLIVAVKPQMMETVLPQLADLAGEGTVAVSVAAGTTINTLSQGLGGATVVRAMPNTPSLVGRGITVACPDGGVSDRQRKQVDQLLRATGKLEWIEDETKMDAVTAVSGSGPAYVFHLAECMAKAGVEAGLPEELAMSLARETVSGAGELLYRSQENAGQLRKNVTSPGGTTAAALGVLMDTGELEALMVRAIRAATERSRELS